MKGISPMIATVLLIGFTVAVGAILAVWFSTYTKTQTSSVSSATACASTTLGVKVLTINSDKNVTTISITNNGPADWVNVTSVTVTCGQSSTQTTHPGLNITRGDSGITTVPETGASKLSNCDSGNVAVDVHATCNGGGTTSGACPAGGCS